MIEKRFVATNIAEIKMLHEYFHQMILKPYYIEIKMK